MAGSPVTLPARQALEHIDALLDGLRTFAPSNTREGLWLNARLTTLQEVRRDLAERLVDVEVEAVLRAMPGTTADHARFLLGEPDEGPDESLLPLPWADGAAVPA